MIFYDSREGSFMVNQMISGLLISSVGGDRRGFSQEHGAAESYLSRVIYCGMIGTLFAISCLSAWNWMVPVRLDPCTINSILAWLLAGASRDASATGDARIGNVVFKFAPDTRPSPRRR